MVGYWQPRGKYSVSISGLAQLKLLVVVLKVRINVLAAILALRPLPVPMKVAVYSPVDALPLMLDVYFPLVLAPMAVKLAGSDPLSL